MKHGCKKIIYTAGSVILTTGYKGTSRLPVYLSSHAAENYERFCGLTSNFHVSEKCIKHLIEHLTKLTRMNDPYGYLTAERGPKLLVALGKSVVEAEEFFSSPFSELSERY
jgi:hypothetical protein